MHIVYVCADPDIPVFGGTGASLHIQEVLRVMAREHQVTTIAAHVGSRRPRDLTDVPVLSLPRVAGRDFVEHERASRLAADAVPELIEAAEHAHGAAGLVYERYSLWSTGGMRGAADRGVPGVLEVNAPLIDERADSQQLGDAAAAEHAAATVFAAAAVVVAVSGPLAAWVRQRSPTPWRVRVVGNGVDPGRFRPRATPPRRPFTVGFVGSLTELQGVHLLIEALCRMADETRLLIVGDGPLRHALRRAAAPLGQRAVFTGELPATAVPAALAQVDVTVAPYLQAAAYASSLKVFEYMAAGTAVVASAVDELASVVVDGHCGLLVAPGDVDALAAAITRLRDEPALRRALGAEARRVVCERHTWNHVVDRIFRLAGVTADRTITLPADDHAQQR